MESVKSSPNNTDVDMKSQNGDIDYPKITSGKPKNFCSIALPDVNMKTRGDEEINYVPPKIPYVKSIGKPKYYCTL